LVIYLFIIIIIVVIIVLISSIYYGKTFEIKCSPIFMWL